MPSHGPLPIPARCARRGGGEEKKKGKGESAREDRRAKRQGVGAGHTSVRDHVLQLSTWADATARAIAVSGTGTLYRTSPSLPRTRFHAAAD